VAQQVQDRTQRSSAALARLDQLLAALPAACDEGQFGAAAQAVANAREALVTTDHALLAAVRDAQAMEERPSSRPPWQPAANRSRRAASKSRTNWRTGTCWPAA